MGRKNEIRVSDGAPVAPQALTLCYELSEPITALGHYLQAARRYLEEAGLDDARLADLLAKATLQAHRAGSLVRELRNGLNGEEAADLSRDASPDLDEKTQP